MVTIWKTKYNIFIFICTDLPTCLFEDIHHKKILHIKNYICVSDVHTGDFAFQNIY